MPDYYDLLLAHGPGHRPIRRDSKVQVFFDNTGALTVEPEDGEAFLLSRDDGSIDRISVVRRDRFFACGCPMDTQAGGQCGEPGCGRVSCATHFELCRCQGCGKPLCLNHSINRKFPDVKGSAWCYQCHDNISRRLARQQIAGFLLRPFSRKAR